MTGFSEERTKMIIMISPGKKQFDLSERRLLEILERVALCISCDGSWLEKVNGVSGEKLETPAVCHFSRSLDTKRKRTRGRVEESIGFREDSVLAMGNSCACLELDGDCTLFIVTGILENKWFLLTFMSSDTCEPLYGVNSWNIKFLVSFCMGWLLKLWLIIWAYSEGPYLFLQVARDKLSLLCVKVTLTCHRCLQSHGLSGLYFKKYYCGAKLSPEYSVVIFAGYAEPDLYLFTCSPSSEVHICPLLAAAITRAEPHSPSLGLQHYIRFP